MKKNILYIAIFLTNALTFGQVGIGTTSPQGAFHIDGNKNTPTNSSTTNVSDDVIVATTSGNVGIGTTTPSVKLEINSTTEGAIKIVDGSQGAGKLLMSNTNGVGTWVMPHTFQYMQTGTFNKNSNNSEIFVNSDATSTTTKYAQAYITLPKGKWVINVGLTIKLSNAPKNPIPYWLKLYLSSSQTTITNSTYSYVSGSTPNFGGNMILNQMGQNPNFLLGSTVIDVPANNTIIYLLIQNLSTDPSGNAVDWSFSTGNYENYFYAVPIN